MYRCPCNTCEFQRRLLKLARNRDELGVQASTEAKRQICYALVRAGVVDFLTQVLNAILTTGGTAFTTMSLAESKGHLVRFLAIQQVTRLRNSTIANIGMCREAKGPECFSSRHAQSRGYGMDIPVVLLGVRRCLSRSKYPVCK